MTVEVARQRLKDLQFAARLDGSPKAVRTKDLINVVLAKGSDDVIVRMATEMIANSPELFPS